jgi:hypothetical protein
LAIINIAITAFEIAPVSNNKGDRNRVSSVQRINVQKPKAGA